MRYRFADCVLDTDAFQLRRANEAVHIEPQVFEVLAYLVAHRDALVSKTELLDSIWGDRFVSEAALTSRIRAARQAIGDDGTRQELIRTVFGRGYQFIANVTVEQPDPARQPGHERGVEQRIQFCTSADGVRIAFATMGEGPPLVRAAHWLTHLDYDWGSPVWRHWLDALAQGRRFVRYDERGCGLSDHDAEEMSLAAWVRDLEAVVDAADIDRFPLLGVSQGGPVAIAYAAAHPQRVSKLVLVNTYSQGRSVRPATDDERSEVQLNAEIVRLGWGREDPTFRRFFTMTMVPDASVELWDSFAELMRRTTAARNALRLMETWRHLDVSELCAKLSLPTLILHSRHDLRVPFEQGRQLASLIDGSHLVPLDSRNHLFMPHEPAWPVFLDELGRFLAS